MSFAPYTADQADVLQEIANVAMGQAGCSLALMLDSYVALSVPRSRIVAVDELADTVAELLGGGQGVTAVRQAFFNRLRGEAIVVFGPAGCRDLADLLGHEGELNDALEAELLLDVSNLLVGAVLNGLAQQLETDFSFSAPSIMAVQRDVAELLRAERLGWSHALLIEVNFALEARDFRCHLVLLMPEESIELMRHALDQLLAAL